MSIKKQDWTQACGLIKHSSILVSKGHVILPLSEQQQKQGGFSLACTCWSKRILLTLTTVFVRVILITYLFYEGIKTMTHSS
jgi:hypothetical protein